MLPLGSELALDRPGIAAEEVIRAGDPKQTKALLRLLIKALRVNGRREILPAAARLRD